jgi:hypothetical protein
MNQPLQRRAGANFPGIFDGVLERATSKLFKAASKMALIYANEEDNLRFILAEFSPGLAVFNRTTDDVTIQLVLEDANGNLAVVNETTVTALTGGGTLDSNGPVYLAKGEKLYYRVTSVASITTGNGLWLLPSFAQSAGLYGKDNLLQRITLASPSTVIMTPEGVSGLGGLFGGAGFAVTALNFGTTDVNLVSYDLITDAGEVNVPLSILVEAGKAQGLSGVVVLTPPGNSTRLNFDGLPTGGPLVVCVEGLFPFNEGDLDLVPSV